MRKTISITLVALLTLISSTINAQEKQKTPEEKATLMTQTLKEQIQFSDEKEEEVYEINLKFVNDLKTVKEKDISKYKKVKELKALDNERNNALKDVLTEGEYKLYKDNKPKNRKAFREKFNSLRN